MKMIYIILISFFLVGFIVSAFVFSAKQKQVDLIVDKNILNGTLKKGLISENPNVKWTIKKSGAEIYLDVNYEIINKTATIFCVSPNNKLDYSNALDLNSKDIQNIPISKTKLPDTFSISSSKIDLSKSKDNDPTCFEVNYPNLNGDISFKVGWESVEIDGSAANAALMESNEDNLCRDSSENLYVAYEGGSNDLWFASSSDDGLSWSAKELIAGTFSNVGVVCYPNNSMTIYYLDEDADMFGINSGNEGVNWGSPYLINNRTASIDELSCISDGNNYLHCVFVDTHKSYYVNSTILNSNISINNDTSDSTDYCDIEVNESNSIFVVCVGIDQDDVDVWSPSLDGWGSAQRVLMYDSSGSLASSHYSLDIAIRENNIWVAFIETADLWVCNTTLDNIGGATCQELDSSASYCPTIGINDVGGVEIIYAGGSPSLGSNEEYRANSTNGINWNSRIELITSSYYPSVLDSTFPTSSRMTDTVRWAWSDSGSDLNYDNYTIPYGGEEPPPTDSSYPLFSNYLDNNGTLIDSGIGLFNVTVNNTNGTVWLEIDGTNLTASNSSSSYCYQENVSVATSCGGLNTGATSWNGAWTALANMYDGDWDTWGFGNPAPGGTLYINYTKPTYAGPESLWQVKDEVGIVNLTLPSDCWNYYSNKIRFKVYSLTNVTWFCYNGSWEILREATSDDNVYEEAMIWNIQQPQTYNVSVSLTDGVYPYKWHSWGNGTSHNYNKSNEQSYTVNSSVVDSCTCAGADVNWEIDMEDNCVLTEPCDLQDGNLTFINNGNFNCSSTLTLNKMEDPGANQVVYIGSDCIINIG